MCVQSCVTPEGLRNAYLKPPIRLRGAGNHLCGEHDPDVAPALHCVRRCSALFPEVGDEQRRRIRIWNPYLSGSQGLSQSSISLDAWKLLLHARSDNILLPRRIHGDAKPRSIAFGLAPSR